MSGSTLHATLIALTALWTGTVPGLQVSDGPIVDPDVNYLAVGWAGRTSLAGPGVSTTRTSADAARARDAESSDIRCVLAFHVGDPSQVAAIRAAMFAAFDLLAAALAANYTLDVEGLGRAWIAGYELEQDIAETGSYLYLHITVQADGWK